METAFDKFAGVEKSNGAAIRLDERANSPSSSEYYTAADGNDAWKNALKEAL